MSVFSASELRVIRGVKLTKYLEENWANADSPS